MNLTKNINNKMPNFIFFCEGMNYKLYINLLKKLDQHFDFETVNSDTDKMIFESKKYKEVTLAITNDKIKIDIHNGTIKLHGIPFCEENYGLSDLIITSELVSKNNEIQYIFTTNVEELDDVNKPIEIKFSKEQLIALLHEALNRKIGNNDNDQNKRLYLEIIAEINKGIFKYLKKFETLSTNEVNILNTIVSEYIQIKYNEDDEFKKWFNSQLEKNSETKLYTQYNLYTYSKEDSATIFNYFEDYKKKTLKEKIEIYKTIKKNDYHRSSEELSKFSDNGRFPKEDLEKVLKKQTIFDIKEIDNLTYNDIATLLKIEPSSVTPITLDEIIDEIILKNYSHTKQKVKSKKNISINS